MKAILNLVSKVIRDVIGYALLCSVILSPQKSRPSLHQSVAKLKPFTIWSSAFSRALQSLVGVTISSCLLLKVFSFNKDSVIQE